MAKEARKARRARMEKVKVRTLRKKVNIRIRVQAWTKIVRTALRQAS